MNRVLLGVVVLLGLAGLAIWLFASRLDGLVAAAIERHGSEIAGAPVRVGGVDLDLRAGRGTIRDLRVGNPEGFSRRDALRFREITLEIETGSLAAPPVVVRSLQVRDPRAHFELDASGRSNLGAIRDHAGAQSPDPAEEPLRLVIRRLRSEQGAVEADLSAVSQREEPLAMDLPVVALDEVGAPAGATPSEVARVVLVAFSRAALTSVAAQEAARRLEEEIGGELGAAAGRVLRGLLD